MAKILVVDDRAPNREVLTTLLGYRGHRVSEATNGVDALEKAHTDPPDLIITDLLMPGMDGFELIRNLRADVKQANTPVIFVTATYLEPEARTLADTCGPHHFVTKPFDPSEFLSIVDRALMPIDQCSRAPESEVFKSPARDLHLKLLQDKLVSKVEQLEASNAQLEERVRDRTQELQAANENLKQQMEEGERTNRDLEQSRNEQIRLRDEFLSHVSHELRSPLAVVHQFVSILFEGLGGPVNTNQKEYLEIALRNVNQLKRMIDDLLEASRADAAKLTVKRSVISAGDVIRQTVQSFSETAVAKGISLQTEIPKELPPVYADPARICQVISNLLDNAIKFSSSESSIKVRANVWEDDSAFVHVSVADKGRGISPGESERIFDRLYQVKDSSDTGRCGLGLGLYICKELVNLHGGKIWSHCGQRIGCTISFVLPVFSIGSLIAPVLKKGTPLDTSFALVTVEVQASETWPSQRKREQALGTVHDLLARCILPDLDVLLPPQSHSETDLFWIVARTNEKGAAVVVKRVEQQISNCEDLKRAGASCSVSSEILQLGAIGSEWPWERQLEWVASSIEERLQVKRTERKELQQ